MTIYVFDSAIFGNVTSQFDTYGHNYATFVETNTITESLSRKLNAKRVILDELARFDPAIFGNSSQFDLTDTTLRMSDVVSRKYGGRRLLSESSPITDAIQRLIALKRTLGETVIISESLQRLLHAIRTITDELLMFDLAVFGDSTQFDQGATSIIVNDVVTRKTNQKRIISESTTVLDSVSRKLQSFTTMLENATVIDLLSRIYGAKRIISENNFYVWLRFENNLTDSSAYGSNGTVSGSTSYTSGFIGQGFNFTGANSVVINNAYLFDFETTDIFSISYASNIGNVGTQRAILDKRSGGVGYAIVNFANQHQITLQTLTGNLTMRLTSGIVGLHDIVWTYDGSGVPSGVKCYVDKVSKPLTTVTNTLSGSMKNGTAITLGANVGGGAPMVGMLDEVIIAPMLFNQNDVNNIYNNTYTIQIGDSITRKLGSLRPIAEAPISIFDLVVRKLSAKRIMAENTTVSDIITRMRHVFRSLSETVTTSDLVNRIRRQNRVITEIISVSDLVTKLKARLRSTTAYLTKRSATNVKLTDTTSKGTYLTKRDTEEGSTV